MTKLLDGKKIAEAVRTKLQAEITALSDNNITPTLAIVLATDDEAARWYVRSIVRSAEAIGVLAHTIELASTASTSDIATTLTQLAKDNTVHGIILQTPLPPAAKLDDLLLLIPVRKDVDGANPMSLGRLAAGLDAFVPATALAAVRLLEHYDIPLAGSHAVVVGRSRIVGKPAALLLLAANATVTICHSHTKNLAAITQNADILVVATGKPRLIGAEHLKPGVIIIDIGTNVEKNGSLVGDVDADAVEGTAQALSPVPGGVGPLTTVLLLEQTIAAASQAKTSYTHG